MNTTLNNIEITQRDQEMLSWINGFGFAAVEQIQAWMGTNRQATNRRLKKLEDAGYIQREFKFFNGSTVVLPTKEINKNIDPDLKPLPSVKENGFTHDRQLVGLSMQLLAEHDGSVFVPERRIRQDEKRNRVKDTLHCADGYLTLLDGRKIAIELELSRKSIPRIKKIMRGWHLQRRVKEVWYFCPPHLVEFISRYADDERLFKVFVWNGDSYAT